MVDQVNRRRVLLASGTAGVALAGCITMAQQQGNSDCVPPGQYECPDGTEFLAKLEFEDCEFVEEESECEITITDFRNKEGEECEPVEFDWEVAEGEDCLVDHIRVYGGNDCEDHDEDGSREGTVTTDLEAGQSGERAAVSNVTFCGQLEAEQTPTETPESQETPEGTPEDTPEDTPEGTPEDTPEDTPEQTPESTPSADDGEDEEDEEDDEEPC